MNRNVKRLYKYNEAIPFVVVSWVPFVMDACTSEAMMFLADESGDIINFMDLDMVRGLGPEESFRILVERNNLVFVRQVYPEPFTSVGEE